MMTLYSFQEALCAETERVLREIETTDWRDPTRKIKGVTAYRRALPIFESDQEEPPEENNGRPFSLPRAFIEDLEAPDLQPKPGNVFDCIPYALIRIYEGGAEGPTEPWTVTALTHLCIHDADTNNRGHEHIMLMLQRLMERFTVEPRLGAATVKGRIKFSVQDDETYPLFFGGLSVDFWLPRPTRGDPDGYC